MRKLANLLTVLGVCLGALGASGFHRPLAEELPREEHALPLFVVGVVALALGGLLLRVHAQDGKGEHERAADLEQTLERIEALGARLEALEERSGALDTVQLRDAIDRLLGEELFELTSRAEELAARLGFADYAATWEGVAVCERLLARAWSLLTDGHREEGVAELGHARAGLGGASAALRGLLAGRHARAGG